MKIAYIITGLGMGGAEREVVSLADRFAESGHTVLIIALTGDAVVRPDHPGVDVQCLAMSKTFPDFVRAYAKAARMIRKFRPDIVHSHMVHANIFARLLRISVTMPRLICSAHSTNEGGKLRMLGYRLTNGLGDVFTNVSFDAVSRFEEKGAAPVDRMAVMHNGIDMERFRFVAEERLGIRQEFGVAESTHVLLAVGSLIHCKDHANLLRAFALLKPQENEYLLWIAGTGPLLDELTALTAELGLAGCVRFLGLRTDIHSVFCAADVFVMSSAWEGMPLVVGEAMACERLVVSTDAGGIREWLADGGWIVPTGSSAELAEALRSAIQTDARLRAELGRAARARVEAHYSLNAVAARWMSMYAPHVSLNDGTAWRKGHLS